MCVCVSVILSAVLSYSKISFLIIFFFYYNRIIRVCLCVCFSPNKSLNSKCFRKKKNTTIYLYSCKNFSWNERNLPSISFSLAGWGRIVVRKWYVPGRCPKPEPGTMQMPVCSNSWNA